MPPAETVEMPAWLNQPPAAPTAGQRWGRRFMFMGVSLLSIALAAGATMLGLDWYEANSSPEVVAVSPPNANTAPASVNGLPFVEKRVPTLPPLVMLPQDPNALKKVAPVANAPVAAAEAQLKAAPPGAAPAPAVSAPPVVRSPKKPVAAAPVAAQTLAKPVKIAAQPPKKLPLAAKLTPAMAAKKAANQARLLATQTVAKVKPNAKPVKGTTLQPPRERGLDPVFQDPPRQAVDRRCRPGELARECEARTR